MLKVILTLLLLGIAVNAKVSKQELTAVVKSLETAVQLDNNCETSSDCAVIGIGARACGGPKSYAAYSVKSSNVNDIRSLAQLSTKLEQQYNTENQVMSICMMTMPPTPFCFENQCEAA